MSKKAKPSLTRFAGNDVQRLHDALHVALPALVSGDIAGEIERCREAAFRAPMSTKCFKYWYFRSQVLKRYQRGTVTAAERQQTAIQKLRATEEACRQTNERLFDAFNKPSCSKYHRYLVRAKKELSRILGSFNHDLFVRSCDFSAGASTEFRRRSAAVPRKWVESTHVTRGALPFAVAFARWQGRPRQFKVVDANVVFTVPKNFRVDRVCTKEAPWTMFFQKGVGNYVRRRLQKHAEMLHPDAQERHAALAKEGSETNRLTTDDLASASDTIACALVQLLYPDDWFRVLWALRSAMGDFGSGELHTWEKISSMGNGFTFEVETSIFYSLLVAVCGRDKVSTYGDDLIYPSQFSGEVRDLLLFCGFETNIEKSFASGPFRESCGAHYYNGEDVSPFYLEQLPTTYGQIIQLHNDILHWHRNYRPLKGKWLRVVHECRNLIPRAFWGPWGEAGVLWSEWDEARPKYRKDFQSWYVQRIIRAVPVQQHEYYEGCLQQAVWRKGSNQPPRPTRRMVKIGVRYNDPHVILYRPPADNGLREFAIQFAAASRPSTEIAIPDSREKVTTCWVGYNQWERMPVRVPARAPGR